MTQAAPPPEAEEAVGVPSQCAAMAAKYDAIAAAYERSGFKEEALLDFR